MVIEKWQKINMARDRKTMASGRKNILYVVIGKWHENMASDRKTMASGMKIWQVTGKQWQQAGKQWQVA